MAACEPCPAPITVSVKMNSGSRSGSKRCSRSSSRASCRGNSGGVQVQACQAACGSGSRNNMPNYMKPLSRTPSYSARITVGGGPGGDPYTACCHGHLRPDCCRVPCPLLCHPKCPLGIYAEKVQSMKPDRKYEPPEIKFEGLSTYREHFFRKCADKAGSFKPRLTFEPSDAKMEGITQYRNDFTGCMTPRPPSFKQRTTFVPSDAKMDGITQYRSDYTGCMVSRQDSYKKATTFVPSDAKMEGITTYRINYIPYCPREYDYARPKQSAKPVGSPSCGQMDGVSTYRMDYYPKCAVKINSMKPFTKPRFSDAKMDGVTTYKNDFIPFHFDKCIPQNCIPAEVYDEYFPNPCLFGCSGDGDGPRKKEEECPDPCPPPPISCGTIPNSGGNFASGCCEDPFPYTAGNAGEQIRDCCKCLDDEPIKPDEGDDC